MPTRPTPQPYDTATLKAIAHPLRQRILGVLGRAGPVTSTTVARELGQNTGTTSYHLRVLAAAGVIEEIAERSTGRERWWRAVPADRRMPARDSLPPEGRDAYDAWQRIRIDRDLRLVHRLAERYEEYGPWVQLSRGSGWYTVEDLQAMNEEVVALFHTYARPAEDRPAGARLIQTRFFTGPAEDDEDQ